MSTHVQEVRQTRAAARPADPELAQIQDKARDPGAVLSPREVARAAAHHLHGGADGAAAGPVAVPEAGGGAPVAAGVRAGVEAATGQPLGDVRVHDGPASRAAAGAMGARAFTVGQDVHLGPGQSAADASLMAHESAHTLHQQGGGGAAQQKSAMSRPGDPLEREADRVADAAQSGGQAAVSVGAGRGVVQRDTAADVHTATHSAERDDTMLAAIFRNIDRMSHAELVATVAAARADLPALMRLGASVASPAALTRLAVLSNDARHRAAIMTGTFRWVDTEVEATALFEAVATCGGGGAIIEILNRLRADGSTTQVAPVTNAATQTRIAGWLSAQAGPSREEGLKAWFLATADSRLDLLQAATSRYFGFALQQWNRGRTGRDWDAAGIRELWPALESMPSRDVDLVQIMGRYQGTRGNVEGLGGISNGTALAAVAYDDRSHIGSGANTESGMVERSDPLYGRNRFDTTVRHEVGHVVAGRLNFATANASGDAFGGWRTYSGWRQCAEEMIVAGGDVARGVLRGKSNLATDTGGTVANPANAFVDIVASALENGNSELGQDPGVDFEFWGALSAAEQRTILQDPVFEAVRHAVASGWDRDDGGRTLGDRKYNREYHEMYSYLAAARARKVSKYQFKAPDEWFAEAYALYYDPSGGPGRLAGRDGPTKAWFDTHVNGRR